MDDDSKDFRRSKPQQKLYKPGSGPLRRSSYVLDTKMDAYDVDNSSRGRNQNHCGSHLSINDEDVREQSNTRHRKPEQQLYVPRSGESGSDIDRSSKTTVRNENTSQFSNRRMSNKHDKHGYNNTGTYSRGGSRRDRSYLEFHSKEGSNNDINYNRNYRQVSEPRSISPKHRNQEPNTSDRNRDSRSMETSAVRHVSGSGGKPPSGRRNSAGYTSDSSRPKYMINLDNIPPRFRKKFLEQSGQHHSFDSVDQLNRDRNSSNHSVPPSNQGQFYNSNLSWSQTLPSRGRGRLKDNEGFDRDKFINTYLKNYEVQNSRRSTPSNSYMNLYEPNVLDNKFDNDRNDVMATSIESHKDFYDNASNNGIKTINNDDASFNHKEDHSNNESDSQNDKEAISQSNTSLLDMSNLDWTEEVEKNIKIDDMCDSSTSFSLNLKTSSNSQEVKPVENRESKRNGRSRRRDKRSSSRGHKNSEKKSERNRKDSNVSIQHEAIISNLKHRERERRDSHKSNRSSTIGNSRDDLDRWRSLRSYSREQSTEGRIVSQCNSRDASTNRAMSPRDHDGFRVPSAMSKSTNWTSNNQKKNGSWASGRTSSVERGRHSPAPSNVSETGGEGGGGRRGQGKRHNRRRRNAEPAPAHAPTAHIAHAQHAAHATNWREEILESKKHMQDKHTDNSHRRNRLNSAVSEKSQSDSATSHPGLLILPQGSMSHLNKDQGRGGSIETQKTLYDHHNPSKPIIVQTNSLKQDMRMERGMAEGSPRGGGGYEASDAARAARHRALLQEVDRADAILQTLMLRGPLALAAHWADAADTRKLLQNALQKLLKLDLKYCQADNIEHHFWKILYYNFIEILRKSVSQMSPEDKPKIVKVINTIIEEGNVFFESLVQMLEETYKFSTDDYLNDNHLLPPKGLGYLGLALISVQKLYVFLGDLARYKEQVNETNNYAKSKYWYTKAQQINPKNGRPYNQLAILAIYARRKLDAVYYYMRSLMSSNPFHSAREGLLSLFEENRRKYEAAERKRRAALESARCAENGEASGTSAGTAASGGLRREVWVRPSGHRTTTLRHDAAHQDEHLTAMTPVELNKTFITSYLHVHGKLITKIGMETFHSSATLMLRQFRALLHRQPLPTPAARLLQLTALNMYAVETTADAHKDNNGGERPAWLECALGVSLLMFGALLERCCALLPEPINSQQHTDALLLLPAVKVWSDWMLCHSSIWNPPPAVDNFDIGSENDPWDWLAKLMNILEDLDDKSIEFENVMNPGCVPVRLAEDASLAGFTPLMYMEPAAAWLRAEHAAPHTAEHALRTRKLLFFGTEYLVGVEPPVLRLEYPADAPPRYVSAVQRTHHAHHPPLHHLSEDSEDEDSIGTTSGPASLGEGCEVGAEGADEATRKLLRRKEQLEIRKATMERHRQRMQDILRGSWVSVEIEVRPRWLVPDTNCFIDHLPLLQAVAASSQPYQLVVPLVVMAELEGLQRCSRVGESARVALAWVNAASASTVRLATARGSLLVSRTFTAERDPRELAKRNNDDRVLCTALNLNRNLPADTETRGEEREGGEEGASARRLRQVVLLTDDRNLRVKALAAELPARDLPSFMHWAGLEREHTQNTQPTKVDDEAGGLK